MEDGITPSPKSAQSIFFDISDLMSKKIPEFIGESEVPKTISSIILAGYVLYLRLEEDDFTDVRVSFHLSVLFEDAPSHSDEAADDSMAELRLEYREKFGTWKRMIVDDDGYLPHALIEISKTLGMLSPSSEDEVSEETAFCNIRILLGMFREKSGLR